MLSFNIIISAVGAVPFVYFKRDVQSSPERLSFQSVFSLYFFWIAFHFSVILRHSGNTMNEREKLIIVIIKIRQQLLVK